jgi:UDP:flavonoid glycosyltransferase YjiC (YdhE family)
MRVLFGILDWGLGHTTRSIPIIDALVQRGFEVVIAASPSSVNLLQTRFPELEIRILPSYAIHYRYKPFWWGMVLQLPRIRRVISQEMTMLNRWQNERPFDLIISDNRLGFRHSAVRSIYISHQLNMKLGIWSKLSSLMHAWYHDQFDEVWIPDDETFSLSGDLGRCKAKNCNAIGHPSRLTSIESTAPKSGEVLLLLSGPEPLRTQWESELLLQAHSLSEYSFHLVRGTLNRDIPKLPNNVRMSGLLDGDKFSDAFESAKVVVARSGYSTLLDMCRINRPIIAIPTPGQGEQEYLAEWHAMQGHLLSTSQEKFDLEHLLEKCKTFSGRLPKAKPLKLPI